ncbi:MAG: glycosyltransferase family 9 protein, partial [Candidatus Omnitrophota bacterium]
PIIRLLRGKYPDAYIAFLVRPENKDVVKNNPHLDKVIVYDKYGQEKSLIDTVKFALKLRNEKFDTAIALHPTNRVHMIMFLAGIPRRIGYDRNMGFLLSEKVGHRKHEGDMHETDYNRDLLVEAGFDVSGYDRKPYMATTDADKKLIESLKKDESIGKEIIAIHAGASCVSKRWDPKRFAETADILKDRYGCDIVLVGGDETSEYSASIVSHMRNKALDLTGDLLVGELAEFLSGCRLFISNDSGPVHIAVAVGTPVITIFGRNDPGLSPRRWGPLGDRDIILHKPADCDRCLAHLCNNQLQCLQAVTTDDVVSAADAILGK